MAIDRRLVEGTYAAIAAQLLSTPKILATLYERKDFARVGLNVDLMTRALLMRGMMKSRVDGKHAEALSDFRLAAEYVSDLERSVAGAQQGDPAAKSNYLDIASFELPILACLLAYDMQTAKAVAQLSREAVVEEREDPVKALMVRLVAALVLDDRNAFDKYKSAYDAMKKSQWWEYFAIYMNVYGAVIHGHQDQYDALAAEASNAFRLRANDKRFSTLRPEYGGGEENELVLDFYLVATAVVARTRGLNVNHFSDIVPRELFVAGGML